MSSVVDQVSDRQVMLSHDMVWSAIDRLASLLELSPSGLARLAGLDPTSFNRSKRFKADGRPRWPSTESIAKVLDVSGTSPAAFFEPSLSASPQGDPERSWSELDVLNRTPNLNWPVIESDQLLEQSVDVGKSEIWQNRLPHHAMTQSIFVVRVKGDAFMPVCRDGSQLLLANDPDFLVGDRVLLRCLSNGLILGDVHAVRTRSLSLSLPSGDGIVKTFTLSSVAWVAKIVWTSH